MRLADILGVQNSIVQMKCQRLFNGNLQSFLFAWGIILIGGNLDIYFPMIVKNIHA